MTVKELKEVIDGAEPDMPVKVCVNTPAGWVCPDGCAIGLKSAHYGIDWHMHEILLVPEVSLDIHDVKAWEHPRQETKPEPDKKDIFMNGMTVEEYIKTLNDAYEASKGSKLVFK